MCPGECTLQIQKQTPPRLRGRRPPREQNDLQTGVKTLPCPNLRLRAVTRAIVIHLLLKCILTILNMISHTLPQCFRLHNPFFAHLLLLVTEINRIIPLNKDAISFTEIIKSELTFLAVWNLEGSMGDLRDVQTVPRMLKGRLLSVMCLSFFLKLLNGSMRRVTFQIVFSISLLHSLST